MLRCVLRCAARAATLALHTLAARVAAADSSAPALAAPAVEDGRSSGFRSIKGRAEPARDLVDNPGTSPIPPRNVGSCVKLPVGAAPADPVLCCRAALCYSARFISRAVECCVGTGLGGFAAISGYAVL